VTAAAGLPPRPTADAAQGSVAWWAGLVFVSLLAALHWVSRPVPLPGVYRIERVQASLPLDPYASPRTVRLPHVLDDESPAWRERVDYLLEWPEGLAYGSPEGTRLALLLPRVGTRFRVLLNGHEVFQLGWYAPADRTVLAASQPQLVPLPSVLLAAQARDNVVRVEVQGRFLERSGLSAVQLGDHDALMQRHRVLMLWQSTGSWIMAALSFFVGGLALFLWRALRERLFILIALAALAHAMRTVLLAVVEPPLSHEMVFFWHRVMFGAFVGFFILTVEHLFGHRLRWVRVGAWLAIAATPWCMIWALWTQDYDYVRLWAAALTVFAALALLAGVVDVARRRAHDDNQRLVMLAALFTLTTGVRDFLVVQLNFPGDGDLRWMSVGGVALILTMGWVLVERATAWARTVHRLNDSLSQTVSVRENELRAAFEQLQAAERQRAVEAERQRLMRDMHDGLGSQLVQTLNLVRNPSAQLDREALASMLRQALDELRLTLDSFEPMEGDLPAILGTLRRRLAPALEGVGIELRWEVQEVAPLEQLDARGVLHLFRCLQEIFANVVKHAKARRITVSTWQRDDQVILSIEDDGVGLPPPEVRNSTGRGLRNVLTRAAKIGASVRFYDAHPGTGIEFAFAVHARPLEVDTDWPQPSA